MSRLLDEARRLLARLDPAARARPSAEDEQAYDKAVREAFLSASGIEPAPLRRRVAAPGPGTLAGIDLAPDRVPRLRYPAVSATPADIHAPRVMDAGSATPSVPVTVRTGVTGTSRGVDALPRSLPPGGDTLDSDSSGSPGDAEPDAESPGARRRRRPNAGEAEREGPRAASPDGAEPVDDFFGGIVRRTEAAD